MSRFPKVASRVFTCPTLRRRSPLRRRRPRISHRLGHLRIRSLFPPAQRFQAALFQQRLPHLRRLHPFSRRAYQDRRRSPLGRLQPRPHPRRRLRITLHQDSRRTSASAPSTNRPSGQRHRSLLLVGRKAVVRVGYQCTGDQLIHATASRRDRSRSQTLQQISSRTTRTS